MFDSNGKQITPNTRLKKTLDSLTWEYMERLGSPLERATLLPIIETDILLAWQLQKQGGFIFDDYTYDLQGSYIERTGIKVPRRERKEKTWHVARILN